MPGAPTPVLGSETATWTAAVGLVALAYGGPLLLARLSPTGDPTGDAAAAAVGTTHAILAVSVWAGVRLVAGRFLSPSAVTLALLAAAVLALALQGAVPVASYGRSGAVLPLAAAVGASTLVFAALLRVGGESDPLVIYGVTLGWVVVGGILVVGVVENRLRQFVTSAA